MGAMKDLALRFCYVCYPTDDRKVDKMLDAMRNLPGPLMTDPTIERVREYVETKGKWPTLDTEDLIRLVQSHEQPDPVCGCGKTSEGICPRCGQDMK